MNERARGPGEVGEVAEAGRPARVLYYVANVHRLTGAQRSLHAFLTGCASSRLSPVVVVPGEGPTATLFRESGIRLLVEAPPPELQSYGGRLLRAGLLEQLATAARAVVPYSVRMSWIIADEGIDLCHFNDSRALLMCGAAARLARVPSVWHVRGDVRGLGRVYLEACGLLADRIITVSKAVTRSLPQRFRSRAVTVYNGIAPPLNPPGRSREELLRTLQPAVSHPANLVLAIMVGSIVPFKGAHHVLRAAQMLAQDRNPACLLTIVGDRPDPEYSKIIDRTCAELQLSNVRFAGWDWRPLDWIRAADLVVLPSVEREVIQLSDGSTRFVEGSEGLPRVILEAMACGRPVVATAVAGVPEQVVDGTTGLLVRPGDPAALADGIRRLASDPGLRVAMGEAARQRATEVFSVAANVRATLQVYDGLLGDEA